MKEVMLTQREHDAILSGLRLLQASLEHRDGHFPVEPNDGDVGNILTCSGDHSGLSVDEIDQFCEDLNTE